MLRSTLGLGGTPLAKLWLCLAVLFAATACGSTSEARVAPPLQRAPSGWVEMTPTPVRVGGETLEASCSDAPGANPAFHFFARRGASNRLVIYFDGGGACWDDVTCSVPRLASGRGDGDGFYKAELLPSDDPARMQGIFDLNNPRNPLKDWSFVFVPYCTGDVHSGANTATYTDPDTGEPYSIRHQGAENFRVVLEWIRANFSNPEQILVTGSSAGAYGAVTHYARIREAFPRGRAVMLGDAGQGVTTADFLARRNTTWRYQLPENVFGPDAAINADDDIVLDLAEHFPQDRFAQYTTAHDMTQTAFYALMGASNACRSWTEKMARDLDHRESASNFRAYLAAGQSHTILRSPLFYAEESGGQPFAEWFAALVSDAAPDNAACAQCLAPPTTCRF